MRTTTIKCEVGAERVGGGVGGDSEFNFIGLTKWTKRRRSAA
jgi:hypothetical protein